jgi:hypothetical protein
MFGAGEGDWIVGGTLGIPGGIGFGMLGIVGTAGIVGIVVGPCTPICWASAAAGNNQTSTARPAMTLRVPIMEPLTQSVRLTTCDHYIARTETETCKVAFSTAQKILVAMV